MSAGSSMSLVTSDSDDNDDDNYILREQAVFIADKTIITTVTSDAGDARDWINHIEFNHANPLRLIVGFDIKLAAPQPPQTSAPLHRPIALLVICTHRSCLIFHLARAKIPNSLSRFLSDRRNNTLVGITIQSKLLQLQQEFALGAGARWVDLGSLTAARYSRPELRNAGVSQLRMFLYGADVERPSPPVDDNWDAEELSNEHVRHACIDAFTCYELGSFLVFPIGRGSTAD